MPRGVVRRRTVAVALVVASTVLAVGDPSADARPASAAVDFGPISHAGLVRIGPAPNGLPLTLELGLVADNAGLRQALRAASDPASPTYGAYLTLAQLRARYGARPAVQAAVTRALQRAGIRSTVDVTGLRVTAPTTVAKAERLLGTTWSMYATGAPGVLVALPDRRPRLPSGLAGNVDVVAGLRPLAYIPSAPGAASGRALRHSTPARALETAPPYDAGTPTRTGTFGPSCLMPLIPVDGSGPVGLSPSQILTAYGIQSLHAAGLDGSGVRLAIVGEGPVPLPDLGLFRDCFGFGGTELHIHGGRGVQPIIESSLDTMVVSMVAPRLASFDLWVRPLQDDALDGDVEAFLQLLAAPVEATRQGTPLPDVISVSYGVCEATVAPFTADRTLVERQLAATAALGITVVVAAGDSGSSACARGVPPNELTSQLKRAYASWPATSQYVLAVGGTNLTLTPENTIASSGVWNDTVYPAPYQMLAGGGGGQSILASRPWWQPAVPFASSSRRGVPDVSAFADVAPGYTIVCSPQVVGCAPSPGRRVATVGGTSAAAPLVAGMLALWIQQTRQLGQPPLGFVPPLLYSLVASDPSAFLDITVGGNDLFQVGCCNARVGYDLASGLGSPLADQIASALAAR